MSAGVRALGGGVWQTNDGTRFDQAGAEERARKWAVRLPAEGLPKGPRGRCSLGNPCDRDRIHLAFLRDATKSVLARAPLCPEHLAEAQGGPKASPAPSGGAPGSPDGERPATGRRRKTVGPPPGGGT